METNTVEIIAPEQQMLVVVKENALPAEAGTNLINSFKPLLVKAHEILLKSQAVVVTDVSQTLDMKIAREYRLALRKIRTESDSVRKALKEESLRRGKAIDGFHHILCDVIGTEEARLDEQEKFIANKEAERKAQLKADREEALKPYGVDASFVSLADMPEATFVQFLENAKIGHQTKIEAQRKAEEERIRIENERLKEEARVREENARLKKEADEREAALKLEREKAAREKAEAEAKAQKEREAAEAERKRIETEKFAAEKEAARKLDEERRKNEEARMAERTRVEAEQRKAAEKARLEREAAEAKAKQERVAREKAEAELKRIREAKEAEEKSKAEAARKAAIAPEMDRLLAFANKVRELPLPEMETEAGKAASAEVAIYVEKLAAWIEGKAAKL